MKFHAHDRKKIAMKKSIVGLLLAASLPLTYVATAVPAAAAVTITPITDCSTASIQTGISDLQASIASLEITGTNAEKDRATLQGKLFAAQAKIDEAKPLDAAAKLTDFRIKVEQLRDAEKISQEDAQALISAVNAVITCLGGTV
jgi:hypothetical protein